MHNNINFFNEDISYTIKQKTLLRQWLADSIQAEDLKIGDLNVILCSDKFLHDMNVKYLAHDTFTDIITFDYSEDKTISGDLFSSIERIRENAKQFSKTTADELHRVIIHGVLHLCNYGDKTKDDKAKMTQMEDTYLSQRPDKLRTS